MSAMLTKCFWVVICWQLNFMLTSCRTSWKQLSGDITQFFARHCSMSVLIFRLDFTPYSSVSFVNFEHLNAGWVGYARHLPYTSNVSVLEKKGISLLKIEQLLCIPNLTRNFECHIQMTRFLCSTLFKNWKKFPGNFFLGYWNYNK